MVRAPRGVGLAFAAFVSVSACACSTASSPPPASDSSERGPSGSGAGGATPSVPADAAVDDDAGGGACNALDNGGSFVDLLAVSGNLPAGLGGTLASGDYVLTDARVYVGTGGIPGLTAVAYKAELAVQDGVFDRVFVAQNTDAVADASAPIETRMSFTFTAPTPSDTSLALVSTCPSAGLDETPSFTATDARITLFDEKEGLALTFDRRQ